MSAGIVFLIFFVGIPLFLFFEHPLIFWLVFVPLAGLGILKLLKWFKK